jgi:Uma2 family endonuclease
MKTIERKTSRTNRTKGIGVSVSRVPKRFSVEEYHRLDELGIINVKVRYELIRGLILEKPAMNPAHRNSLRRLTTRMLEIPIAPHFIETQAPITLADSEPEPDLSIWAGPDGKYRDRHAGPEEILLAVEIADSSLAYDRGEKLQLYAESKIPIYWIVNIRERKIEVYTQPKNGGNPSYRSHHDYKIGDSVPVVLGKKTVGSIPVSEILP